MQSLSPGHIPPRPLPAPAASPSLASSGPSADGEASSELVLSIEEGGVFWPLLKQRTKPGQRFMLAYSGQIDQLYVTPEASGLSTPQCDCPEQDSNSCTGGIPARTCRKGSEAITVLFATGQANEYEAGKGITSVIAPSHTGGNNTQEVAA